MGCVNKEDIDSFYVPADNDDGGPRMYWRVLKCPRCDECSDQAWNRVRAWSFINEDTAKDVVIKHLVNSSKHSMDEDAAGSYREDMEIEVLEETGAERDAHRKQIDRIEKISVKPNGRSLRQTVARAACRGAKQDRRARMAKAAMAKAAMAKAKGTIKVQRSQSSQICHWRRGRH